MKPSIYQIVFDWRNTAFRVNGTGPREWEQIGHGGYYAVDSSEVPKEVKEMLSKIKRTIK